MTTHDSDTKPTHQIRNRASSTIARRRGRRALAASLGAALLAAIGWGPAALPAVAADATVSTFGELAAAAGDIVAGDSGTITLTGDMAAEGNLSFRGEVTLRADSPVTIDIGDHQTRVVTNSSLTLTENITLRQAATSTVHPVYLESNTRLDVLGASIVGQSPSTSSYTINSVGAGNTVNVIGGTVTTVNGRALYTNTQANVTTLEDATITATGSGSAIYRGIHVLRGGTTTTGSIAGGAELYDFRGYSVSADPSPSAYENGDSITLTSGGTGAGSAEDATLRYTTDGTDPATSPTARTASAAFPVTVGTTVTAAMVKDGHRSSLTTFEYAVDNDAAPGELASVESFADLWVPLGTATSAIALPEMAEVTLADGRVKILAITWDASSIDTTTAAEIDITGGLALTPHLTNPDGLTASLRLSVGETEISGVTLTPTQWLTAGKSNTASGSVVGVLSASGGDGSNYSYSIAGDPELEVVGDELVAASDLSAGTHAFDVTVTSGAHSITVPLTLEIASAGDPFVIANPYDGIDWGNVHFVKSALHNHTINTNAPIGEWSDGVSGTVASRVPLYESLGYGAVAITEHDYVSYPWSDYGLDDTDVIAIPGNELSKNAHILSYFTTYRDRPGEGTNVTDGLDASIAGVAEKGGFVYIAHPGRSGGRTANPDFTADLHTRFPQVRGIEVLNAGQFTNNHAEDMWDTLLTRFMPERPIYGTASDDSHSDGSTIGTGWTYLLVDELTQSATRDALAEGRSFFSSWRVEKGVDDNKPDPGIPAPLITEITVADDVIGIAADGTDTIEWISAEGRIVGTGASIDVNATAGVESYVRARLVGPGGQTMTQPFGLFTEADTTAPEVSIPSLLASTQAAGVVEPGTTLTLPLATAVDDRSGALQPLLTVVTPDGDEVLALDLEFTVTDPGTYTFRYDAVDGARNVGSTQIEYTVRSEDSGGPQTPGGQTPGGQTPGGQTPTTQNPPINPAGVPVSGDDRDGPHGLASTGAEHEWAALGVLLALLMIAAGGRAVRRTRRA